MDTGKENNSYFNNGNRLFWLLLGLLFLIGFLYFTNRIYNENDLPLKLVNLEKWRSLNRGNLEIKDTLDNRLIDSLIIKKKIEEEKFKIQKDSLNKIALLEKQRIDDLNKLKRDSSFIKEEDKDNSILDRESENKKNRLENLYVNDSIAFEWTWTDYEGKWQKINFKLSASDLQRSENNRIAFRFHSIAIWQNMYHFDKKSLQSIVNAYRNEILNLGYTGQNALNFIISSIQYLGYTYVCSGQFNSRCGQNKAPIEDCRPLNIGGRRTSMGCCDNVLPYAVFSPFEFAFNKMGDCDTKALFAYTILKELGYKNVFMLYGAVESGYHAMLGIKTPSPPFNAHFVVDRDGQKVYAWETTGMNHKLGQKVWNQFKDWKINM